MNVLLSDCFMVLDPKALPRENAQALLHTSKTCPAGHAPQPYFKPCCDDVAVLMY